MDRFIDGWDFTPSVGAEKTRGEVFTPRHIVEQMIVEAGIVSAEAVYEQNYRTLTVEQMKQVVTSRVFEPAVGTGNYLATILWHKIQYANVLAEAEHGHPYHQYLLEAVGSVYACDIDAGNLYILSERLLKVGRTPQEAAEHFTEQVGQVLSKSEDTYGEAALYSEMEQQVCSAEKVFRSELRRNEGVINTLYQQHTGELIPEALLQTLQSILDSNLLLFDVTNPANTFAPYIIPGYTHIVWLWRETQEDTHGNTITTSIPVPFIEQLEE